MSGSSRRRSSGPALGQDAFLDIVANLVGILIILVVILGSRSQEMAAAIDEQSSTTQTTTEQAASANLIDAAVLATKAEEYETEVSHAVSALRDSQRLESLIEQSDARVAAMERDRGTLLDLLELAKVAWEEKQKTLDKDVVARAKASVEQEGAESRLTQLQGMRVRLENAPEPVVAVEHLPSPMARTVFGEELHFRLKDGRLSVVPMELLMNEAMQEFRRAINGKREGTLDMVVGPVRDYVARIEVNKSRGLMSRGGQVSMGASIEATEVVFEPLSEPYGQPLDEVLAAGGSQLDIELAGRSPERTTITVWVYPDDFADMRRLKEHLYARGYAAASRPLPNGISIGVSPGGSKSRAQ